MRFRNIIFSIMLLQIVGQAQPVPDTLWTRTYGDEYHDHCYSACQTFDGGYVLAGTKYRPNDEYNGNNAYMVNINEQGQPQWSCQYGDWDCDYLFRSIIQSLDSGYVAVGYSSGEYDSWGDMLVIKTNRQGARQWLRHLSVTMDKDYGNSIIEMADGGYAIAGVCDYWGRGPFFCVFRIDGQGSLLWWWEYDSSSGSAESIQLTEDGGLIAVGNIYRSGSSSDYFIAKLNSQGDSLWTRYYGGPGIEVPYSLQITRDGGCIMAGKTNSFGAGVFDVYVIRTDSLGDSLWARTYGESGNECAYDMQSTSDGGYIIAGDTDSRGAGQSDFYLIKIDSNGDTLWTRTYGGSGRDQVPSVQQTTDGGYFLAGSTNSFGGGPFDMFVIKTGPDQMQVIDILYPLSNDHWVINSYNTVIWDGHGFDWPVSILLNRDYPYGEWETLVTGTDNDGIEEIWITEPVSSHCRLSISAVGYSPSDISDDDFIITTQQGYLSLINQADPAAPIQAWNLDTLDCAFEYSQSFHMINLGHSQLSFQLLEPSSSEFSLQTNCIGSTFLQPGAMSACSLTLIFDPAADGFYSDTLFIQTDAVNAVDGHLRIPLSGMQVSTPQSPAISVAVEGPDIWLSWLPVTQSVGDCPVTVTAYLIFNSEELNGPYVYHGVTTDTHYVHSGVSQYLDRMYYRVIATTVPISLFQSLPANGSLTEIELLSRLRANTK